MGKPSLTNLTKCAAVVLIVFLALVDFNTVLNIFLDPTFDIPKRTATLYAMSLAFAMEGFPTLISFALVQLLVATDYKVNAKGYWIALLAIASIAFVASAGDVCLLRMNLIAEKDALHTEPYPGRSIDQLLIVLPLITSALAFAASWAVFQPDKARDLEQEAKRLYATYLKAEQTFQTAQQALASAREDLWTSVTDHKPIPTSQAVFKQECFARVKGKAIDDTLTVYDTQVKRFSAGVEAQLAASLPTIASHAAIPTLLSTLQLPNILAEADTWSGDTAMEALKNELKTTLDNRRVVAQVHTNALPYSEERGTSSC